MEPSQERSQVTPSFYPWTQSAPNCALGAPAKLEKFDSPREMLACCRWGKRPISFFLPKSVEPLVDKQLEARAVLAQAGTPTLLVSPTGLPFTLSRFSQYWDEILAHWRAPARFSPQKLRHIYVEERCSLDAAPVGPPPPH